MKHWELVDIVSAANIAGHMEHAGTICLPDDEELLYEIQREYEKYCAADIPDDENWYDWIEDALVRDYGIKEHE